MPESLKAKTPAIAATAAAAVTVTWLSSFAGVNGTLIGVAASSVVSGVAVALYERWIRRAHSRISQRMKARGYTDPWESYYRPAAAVRRFDIPWKRAAILAGCALAISLASVLSAEAIARKPVAAIVTGNPGHGCTVCGGSVAPQVSTPSPETTWTPVPQVSTTPSPSPSPTVSAGSPTITPSPSPSPTVTVSPSPTLTVSTSP